ncbi:MAG: hypothetical protein ACJA2Q_000684 [Pseudohongiellaceae bacterium]|jgi:hypothetical protein
MKISLQQIAVSLAALVLATAVVIFVSQNPAQIGAQSLLVRALILSLGIVSALVAVYPLNRIFSKKPGSYIAVVCLPAVVPVFLYYLLIMPSQAGVGFTAEQLTSELITDSSSNGLVEVGFSYPIYTPRIRVTNKSIFTAQVNIFLRMVDANGENSLFRAVRNTVPGSGLTVESAVRGLVSESDDVLFLPLALPPLSSMSGQLVFVIANLDDGSSFTQAVGSAYQAQFEIRSRETGALLYEFPLNR